MQVNVTVHVPEPSHPKGSIVYTENGHTVHVKDIITSVPAAAVFGSVHTNKPPWQHMYILVVQKSILMRPGSVIIAFETSSGSMFGRSKKIRNHKGAIIGPDTVEEVNERVQGYRNRG